MYQTGGWLFILFYVQLFLMYTYVSWIFRMAKKSFLWKKNTPQKPWSKSIHEELTLFSVFWFDDVEETMFLGTMSVGKKKKIFISKRPESFYWMEKKSRNLSSTWFFLWVSIGKKSITQRLEVSLNWIFEVKLSGRH